jgi:hypothetical protein
MKYRYVIRVDLMEFGSNDSLLNIVLEKNGTGMSQDELEVKLVSVFNI